MAHNVMSGEDYAGPEHLGVASVRYDRREGGARHVVVIDRPSSPSSRVFERMPVRLRLVEIEGALRSPLAALTQRCPCVPAPVFIRMHVLDFRTLCPLQAWATRPRASRVRPGRTRARHRPIAACPASRTAGARRAPPRAPLAPRTSSRVCHR